MYLYNVRNVLHDNKINLNFKIVFLGNIDQYYYLKHVSPLNLINKAYS